MYAYFQVRERLRVALERCSLLEEELGATHKEVSLMSHHVFEVRALHFYLNLKKIMKTVVVGIRGYRSF